MISEEWELSQQNEIKFVMIDSSGNNVAGLGNAYLMTISKPGNTAFVAAAGTKQELANGWYRYVSTAAEADTPGAVALYLPAQGAAIEQNLEYVVMQRNGAAIAYTYTVTSQTTGLPLEGVRVTVTTDLAGLNVIWNGDTDTFGVARDDFGNLPRLDAGVYYFWKNKPGYVPSLGQTPDIEVIS